MTDKQHKLYEVDLYKPVQKYFVKNGFEVHGEVNHCDLAAVKEDELVIVEFKLNLSVNLLVQAAKRQKLTDMVYIAIPKPKHKTKSKSWQDLLYLLKRLELGLLLVSIYEKSSKVDVALHPAPFDLPKSRQGNKRKRERIITEMAGRNGDYNLGGSTKTTIMTAYRQSCLFIAHCLDQKGPLSPKKLRELGTGDKTYSILNKNFYNWFEKVERGVYTVNEQGRMALKENPGVVREFLLNKDFKDEGKLI